jgi:transcriptional regulator with XRE-family HTH domain
MPKNPDGNALGNFLRDRRSRIDPASFGFPTTRRRTPGLRREEVALLANVSPAWYTWLEQGRGGAPSTDVLDRLAQGLRLTEAEREHLYMLAQNRPPEVVARESEVVGPGLQHILDSLELSPAAIRSSAWDVLAANLAARVILGPGKEVPDRYNILENFFARADQRDEDPKSAWTAVARAVVAQFRTEAFQAGFGPRAQEVAEGLARSSPVFSRLWGELDVGLYFESIKTFVLPGRGPLTFETATFSVDGQLGLKLMVFTPASREDRLRVKQLLDESKAL